MKRLIHSFVRVTRLNIALSVMLDAVLWIVLLKCRIFAWFYGRVWPLLGVKYFDQRFIWLYGPQHWEWAERGMFVYMAARPGCIALDLACGDGLYPGLFLKRIAGAVDAVDLDAHAIGLATRRYGGANMRFVVGNMITDPFPRTDYDLVSCFATFQYFPVADAAGLAAKIAAALSKKAGVFVGSVPLFIPPLEPDPHAIHSFRSEAEVRGLLEISFGHVELWCSTWTSGLVHCYFQCSQPKSVPAVDMQHAVATYARQFNAS
jgi:hypothetical protein